MGFENPSGFYPFCAIFVTIQHKVFFTAKAQRTLRVFLCGEKKIKCAITE
jgi:hypothetical protein